MTIAMMPRPHSGWRKSMFAKLVERDGAACVNCGVDHRWIYRVAGVWAGPDWGEDEGRSVARYSKVNRSSNLEVDHKTALHLGGFNGLDNLWLLCRGCHKVKTAAEQSRRLKGLFAAAMA